jgi:maltose O-acetyltransferase
MVRVGLVGDKVWRGKNNGGAAYVLRKILSIAYSEIRQFHPRLWLASLLMAPLPLYVGGRLRTQILRLAGFRLGAGTMFIGTPVLTGLGDISERLAVGKACIISWGCYFDLQDAIRIGDRVGIGPLTVIITSGHSIDNPHNRVGELVARPVTIGDGAFLGARCTIMPGVSIGAGAVVAAGSVVSKDVPAHTVVGGVPARVYGELDGHGEATDSEQAAEALARPQLNVVRMR